MELITRNPFEVSTYVRKADLVSIVPNRLINTTPFLQKLLIGCSGPGNSLGNWEIQNFCCKIGEEKNMIFL